MALASSEPSASSARSTANSKGRSTTNNHGASAAWAASTDPVGEASNGHPKATTPSADAASSRAHERHPSRTAETERLDRSGAGTERRGCERLVEAHAGTPLGSAATTSATVSHG